MEDSAPNGGLLKELAKERSIRRVLRVLQTKRSRINDDLDQLVTHLGLLIPPQHTKGNNQILLEALNRLDSDGFTELLRQIIQNSER